MPGIDNPVTVETGPIQFEGQAKEVDPALQKVIDWV
jgi:hypothetical protein